MDLREKILASVKKGVPKSESAYYFFYHQPLDLSDRGYGV